MALLIADPEWPEGVEPVRSHARAAGSGVGGRRYWRLQLAGPWGASLFAKDFGAGRAARAGAMTEFQAGQRLRAAGGPCSRAWAVWSGAWEPGGPPRTVLLSEDCGDGSTVARETVLADDAKLQAVARLAAELHCAGAVHGDLHLGNLLRCGDRLLWTDLAKLRFPPETSSAGSAAAAQLRDLGRLVASLEPLSRRGLLRFTAAYLQRRGAAAAQPAERAKTLKSTARSVEAAALQRLREHHDNLDRRARRETRGAHPAIWRDPALEAWRGLLESAAAETRHGPGESLKEGNRSRVVRAALPDGRIVVVKHFFLTKALDPRNRMGRSKALAGLFAAEGLIRRGVPAAQPLAAWSRAGSGSWLVLEDLPRHRKLHRAAAELRGDDRRALFRETAQMTRWMHAMGVAYRDLKPGNLLADPQAPEGSRLACVDHDRNRFSREAVPPEVARRDLAALHAGMPPEVRAAERMAALRAYDRTWCRRELWRRHVVPLLEEAARRKHHWVPRSLLGSRSRESIPAEER